MLCAYVTSVAPAHNVAGGFDICEHYTCNVLTTTIGTCDIVHLHMRCSDTEASGQGVDGVVWNLQKHACPRCTWAYAPVQQAYPKLAMHEVL